MFDSTAPRGRHAVEHLHNYTFRSKSNTCGEHPKFRPNSNIREFTNLGENSEFTNRVVLGPGRVVFLPPGAHRAPCFRTTHLFRAQNCTFWGNPRSFHDFSGVLPPPQERHSSPPPPWCPPSNAPRARRGRAGGGACSQLGAWNRGFSANVQVIVQCRPYSASTGPGTSCWSLQGVGGWDGWRVEMWCRCGQVWSQTDQHLSGFDPVRAPLDRC